MQVPGLAVVALEGRARAGVVQHRVHPGGRGVDVARGHRLEDFSQLGGDGAERRGLLVGDLAAAAGRLEHGGDSLGPLGAVGRQVLPAAVLALGQQVHQPDRDPDDEICVTVKIHLTSYFLPLYGGHCQRHLNQ